MKRQKKKISIMKLLIFSNCFMMIFFFSIDSFFSQRSYKKVLEEEMEANQYQMLVYISDTLEQSMNSIELLARSAANNYTIINNMVYYMEHQNSYEQMVFQNNMNQNLSSYAYSLGDIVSMNVLMENNRLKTTKTNGVYSYVSYMTDGSGIQIKEMSSGWIPTRQNMLQLASYKPYIVSYALRVYSGLYYGDGIGHIVINLNERFFYNQLSDYVKNNETVILLTDMGGSIISSTDRTILGRNIEETEYGIYRSGEWETDRRGKKKIISQRQMENQDFTILAVSDYDKVTAPIKKTQSLIFITSIALLSVFSLFSALLAYKLSKPILKLSNEVVKVKDNDFKSAIEVPSNIYEIDVLCGQFNHMTDQINHLINRLLEQEKQKQKQESEILQAQINPHFLYNTLEAINWMALSMKQKEISNMVILLGTFLRLSLNKGKNVYSVQDELAHLKCYVEIQKIRCRGKILFTTDIEEEIAGFRMIKLLLQPLVENSILHGFDSRGGIGQIWVKGYEMEEFLCFSIIDDGCGMSEELIEQICDTSSDVGHGIKNVKKRIGLYYGDACGLMIQSTLQVGTTIEIRILKEIPNQQD